MRAGDTRGVTLGGKETGTVRHTVASALGPKLRMNLHDEHNHFQEGWFAGRQDELQAACAAVGVGSMVVDGSGEGDWPTVLSLARRHPQILQSFGSHPWYLEERSPNWESSLNRFLAAPSGVAPR